MEKNNSNHIQIDENPISVQQNQSLGSKDTKELKQPQYQSEDKGEEEEEYSQEYT